MDVVATLDAPCSPERLFDLVDDLSKYPQWLDIVARAVPAKGNGEMAWTVDLRGRVGPFARSKRLRMVRARHEAPSSVVFERRELDGRAHSAWTLGADVAARSGGSRLTMRLQYDGKFWGPVVERLLTDEIEPSKARLLALIEASGAREG